MDTDSGNIDNSIKAIEDFELESDLHKVVIKGNKEITKLLLENGANINQTDNLGKSTLPQLFKTSKI